MEDTFQIEAGEAPPEPTNGDKPPPKPKVKRAKAKGGGRKPSKTKTLQQAVDERSAEACYLAMANRLGTIVTDDPKWALFIGIEIKKLEAGAKHHQEAAKKLIEESLASL